MSKRKVIDDKGVRNSRRVVTSSLWSRKIRNLSDKKVNPSPMCDDIFPDSAQGLGIFTNSYKPVCYKMTGSIEKSSLPASGNMAAGMTVEAALVLPLFLFFMLNIGSIIEMIRLHGNMQLALWDVGNKAAVYAYALEEHMEVEGVAKEEASENEDKEDKAVAEKEEKDVGWWEEFAGAALTGTFLKWLLVESLGEGYLELSPAVGGVDAIFLWESDFVKENGEMELVVTYGAQPLFDVPGLPYFRMVNRYYGHTWTGYRLETDVVAAKVVFLAENPQVYHLYRDCTHLMLTVREIWEAEVETVRNLYGGRYDACEKCASGTKPHRLFIAMEGDCFHYVRECPGLKRTVYTVSALEVQDMPLCSRCDERKGMKE